MESKFCEQQIVQQFKTHDTNHVPLHPNLTITHLHHKQLGVMTEDTEITEAVPSFVICPETKEGGTKCKVMMQHCKIDVLPTLFLSFQAWGRQYFCFHCKATSFQTALLFLSRTTVLWLVPQNLPLPQQRQAEQLQQESSCTKDSSMKNSCHKETVLSRSLYRLLSKAILCMRQQSPSPGVRQIWESRRYGDPSVDLRTLLSIDVNRSKMVTTLPPIYIANL